MEVIRRTAVVAHSAKADQNLYVALQLPIFWKCATMTC